MRGCGMDPDYRSELLEEALVHLRVPDDCREDAEFWILDVARVFRERHAKERSSVPRLADLKKQTGAIEEHAAELVRLLNETDSYFVRAAVGYLGIDNWTHDQGAPHLSLIVDYRERTQLTTKLQSLASLANHLLEVLPKDTGGPNNLQDIFEGPSRWSLAVNCWELFDWFREGEATGDVNKGDYHTFVEIVYELAVQKPPNTGLAAFTKQAATRCRAYAERTPAYQRLRRALPPGHSPAHLLTASGLAADLYGVPAKLRDEIVTRKRHR